MMLRRELPAYSPLNAASIRQAIVHGLGPGKADLTAVRRCLDDSAPHWPGGEELARTLCTVPIHSLVTAAERAELIQALQAYERRA